MKEKFKILVVDDEESVRTMLTQHLTEEGYSVLAVSSGEEALEIFRIDADHLVLTDIRMGGMSGVELLEEIKGLDEDAVVIIITSHASLDSAVATLRAGAYDYLFKPFDDLDLVTEIIGRAMKKITLLNENRALIEELERANKRLEESSEALREIAITDNLTGLFNQRHFNDVLDREIARARRYGRSLSLAMADIDHFRDYNENNGQEAGDEVLKGIADIITRRLRVVDSSARYGGEEFAILLTETDAQGARLVAEEIRGMIENYPFEGRESQPLGMISMSFGAAAFPDDSADSPSMLAEAQGALMRAKNMGRNRTICSSDPE